MDAFRATRYRPRYTGQKALSAAVLQTDDAPLGRVAQTTNHSSLSEEYVCGVQIYEEGGN